MMEAAQLQRYRIVPGVPARSPTCANKLGGWGDPRTNVPGSPTTGWAAAGSTDRAPDATMVHVSGAPQVTDNLAGSRFELKAGDRIAELRYRHNARLLVIIPTEVP